MKKSIILILTISLILGVFASCGHKTVDPIDDQTTDSPSENTSTESTTEETNDANQSENTETDDRLTDITEETSFVFVPEDYGYTIEKIGDNYYIKFLAKPKDRGEIMGVEFSSLQQFYRVLHLQEPIPYAPLYNIYAEFEKDDIGYKIFDIDNIYYPVLPDGMTFYYPHLPVYWDQYTYLFSISYDNVLQGYGTSDGIVRILPIYNDYVERYNSERYSNATVLTSGDKEARFTVECFEDEYTSYYEYRVLLKSGNVYAEIQLATHELFEDNSIFLDFDFEKYP